MSAKAESNFVHLNLEKFEQYSSVCDVFKATCGVNGTFTFDQMFTVFQKLDPNWTMEMMQHIWTEMDKDQSGDVDFGELLHYAFNMDNVEAWTEEHKGLMKTNVFCRIRPIGKDGHGIGQAVDMQLDGWTEESVFLKGHKREEYTWPSIVLAPEASQEETFKAVMYDPVDAWIMNNTNVMLFAYGQTGTGKTHTMFGPRESLSSEKAHPDWGLFPRAAHRALSSVEAFAKATEDTAMSRFKVALHASAIEFYFGQTFDLYAGKVPLVMMPDGTPVGLSSCEIKKVGDLAPFLDTVYANRSTSGTAMNSGSSRGHAALVLTLAECAEGPEKNKFYYVKRTLTLLDMAGSERPNKAGTERYSVNDVTMMLLSGKTPSKREQQGMEGLVINLELSSLRTEFVRAGEANKTRQKYKNNGSRLPIVRYIGRCLTGQAWLTAVVCLSQSPQNGWETWFSCEYGKSVAKCSAPVRKVKLEEVDDLEKRLIEEAATAKRAVEGTPEKGHPSSKFYGMRLAALRHVEEELLLLQKLAKETKAIS